MYFETHAHYDDERYKKDRDALLGGLLAEGGVDYILNCGADMKGSRASVAMSRKYSQVYASVGVHPHCAKDITDDDLEQLARLSEDEKCVAIGEIGLDYFRDLSPRDVQVTRFKDQLNLALDLRMPVIIHSRDASQETFDILKASGIGRRFGGVIHCYSGSAEMAVEYMNMGFFIGVGGVITYPNSRKLIETVEALPIDAIVLETDCPYLSPEPHRGERNDSRRLSLICERIAQIKGLPHEKAAERMKNNAFALYRIG